MTDTVFHLRPAALHDLEDVVAFCQACEAAVAGQSFLSTDGDPHKAHMNLLGVVPAWRRQGLGLAMLYEAFGEFYRRDKRAVDLSVEATNPTGATQLYERAGMRVVRQYDDYEKELR